ncbi:MAG: DUF1080 domain-containing protein, partial [Planctomycetes bacterium]|nr:DUF1080 domain-containing protein [Planctomycetota bacterium]
MVSPARSLSLWTLVTSILLASPAVAEETSQAISPKEDVIKLFDGKSLDGLYSFLKETKYEDPKNVFRVTDGMLHITGDGLGSIITKNEYRDYHLVL